MRQKMNSEGKESQWTDHVSMSLRVNTFVDALSTDNLVK